MPLTDLSVRNAAPKGSQYKVSDSGGLYLLVRPDGARYWRMDYRLSGRRGTLAFGVYPDVSLADAREKREIAKKQLAAGIDPAVQRKLDKIAAAETRKHTFRVVADEWIEKLAREGKAPATLEKIKWLIGLACLVIGDRPVAEIAAP